jgi:hypothetical protein
MYIVHRYVHACMHYIIQLYMHTCVVYDLQVPLKDTHLQRIRHESQSARYDILSCTLCCICDVVAHCAAPYFSTLRSLRYASFLCTDWTYVCSYICIHPHIHIPKHRIVWGVKEGPVTFRSWVHKTRACISAYELNTIEAVCTYICRDVHSALPCFMQWGILRITHWHSKTFPRLLTHAPFATKKSMMQ